MTTWEGAPEGKIHRYDVVVAKNYLSHDELQVLARIVNASLDFAEMQAMRQIPMTMADWETRLNGFLTLWDREVLQDAGRITAERAKASLLDLLGNSRVIAFSNFIVLPPLFSRFYRCQTS